MKTLNKILLAVTASTVVMTGANAALAYDETSNSHRVLGYAGQPYVGLKVGQFTTDLNDSIYSSDKPTAYGVYGGYQFDPNWAAEVEYVGSDKADLTNDNVKYGDVKSQTFGAYGVYRYNFPNTNAYGKAKLGIAQNKVKANYTTGEVDSSKTSIAGGLGLGYNISPQFAVEAEYAFLPKPDFGNDSVKSDLWTIGAHMKF